MRFVVEAVLPSYVRELERALDQAARRAPEGRLRSALARFRRGLAPDPSRASGAARLAALRRLVALGESEGWLTAEEAIVIHKLAYRVAFYARRAARGEG